MFEQMGTYDQGFEPVDGNGSAGPAGPFKRRKPLARRLIFWCANLFLVAPAIIGIYLTVVADGLRNSLSVFATRISKLAIPGIGIMAEFDGFDRIDIATVTALIMCVTVSYLWYRIFIELSGHGRFVGGTGSQNVLMWVFAAIAAVLIVGDAFIFYAGMSGQAASGWGTQSNSVCIGATIVYAVGLAFLGGYHADYHTTEEI